MKKTINFLGKPCTIENNALLPRKYRHTFGRDLIVDMDNIRKAYAKDPATCNTEVLENITWLMLKEGGEDVGDNVEDWLASIDDIVAVYQAEGEVVQLWADGRKTTSVPKKK